MSYVSKGLIAVAVGAGAMAYWWRKNPSACPYAQRFWVQTPHPFITRDRLISMLKPEPGQCILEIGPGTGYYTLDVANALFPDGTLEIFDIQQEMLDHTMRRAEDAGLSNVVPRQGDAKELPYEEESFDAVYLVTTLGEIPDRAVALREIHRVLKLGARLVVGELFGDPHMVTLKKLKMDAAQAGLDLEDRSGPPFGFFALFRKRQLKRTSGLGAPLGHRDRAT